MPSETLYPSETGYPAEDLYPEQVTKQILVREKPPLRLAASVETPEGRVHRWGGDEPDASRVLTNERFSTTMPGGFESCDGQLARRLQSDASDLERLSTVTIYGPGVDTAWEGRLERAAKASGDRMSVSPGLVGWQAHLEDDKSVAVVYVDRDLSHWRPMSRTLRIDVIDNPGIAIDPQAVPDQVTGLPALVMGYGGSIQVGGEVTGIAVYDAGPGAVVTAVYYDYTDTGTTPDLARLSSGDSQDSAPDAGTNVAGSDAQGYFTPSSPRRFIHAHVFEDGSGVSVETVSFEAHWRKLTVYGTDIARRGADPGGVYGSDVLAHALAEFCPLLNFSEGTEGSIRPDEFVIPHLTSNGQTTVAEIVRQVSRFGLQDWAVWDDKTFHWAPRGTFGRSWRARASQSQLEETGQSAERLWNGIVVEYRDVDGSAMTVGPPGSGADTESADLRDNDALNPANQLDIRRWDKLQMGVSTAAGAVEVGRRFLEETAALDRSGRASLAGHVQDDRGVFHPAWRVRAGDSISFVDTADPSPRWIVRTDYSHAERTCSVDLGAPPAALDALLARLDVVLVPLGL